MINSKTFFLTALAAVTLLSTAFAFLPMAQGHGVQAQLQSRFVKISDESFSAQTVHTGDAITVKGTLQSLVNRPLRAWLSLFSDSTNAGVRWELLQGILQEIFFYCAPSINTIFHYCESTRARIFTSHTAQYRAHWSGSWSGANRPSNWSANLQTYSICRCNIPVYRDRGRLGNNICNKTVASHLSSTLFFSFNIACVGDLSLNFI